MSDEQVVLGLFRKLMDEDSVYVDTRGPDDERRLCIDGTTYDVTDEELDALSRWWRADVGENLAAAEAEG